MRTLDFITLLLVVVGALNWGLVGLARFDLVAEVFGLQFGQVSAATSVIYILVALFGVYQAVVGFRRPVAIRG